MSKRRKQPDGRGPDSGGPDGAGDGAPARPGRAYIHVEMDMVTGAVDVDASVPHMATADHLLAEAKRGLDAEYMRQQASKSGLWVPPRPGVVR